MNLVQPPAIVLQILVILGVDGLHLAGSGAFGEKRGDEELGEAVQGTCGGGGGVAGDGKETTKSERANVLTFNLNESYFLYNAVQRW
jgi:hypothetical protein